MKIQCSQLGKTFGNRPLFKGTTLQIESGQIVSLQGRSGVGKSTLLYLLAGLDLNHDGKVLWDSVDLETLSERERCCLRAEKLGFLFQEQHLVNTWSLLDNLLLAFAFHPSPQNETAAALRLLDEFGLSSRANDLAHTLSGGERQRLALARALVHHPAMILCDEPTSSLDLETSQQVCKLLIAKCRERNTGMLWVTHETEIAALADRHLTLRDGLVEEA